jgi:DNA-binding NarL/FixJ family response regulator
MIHDPRPTSLGNARILVVEDHPVVREAFVELINRQDGLEACADADSIRSADAAVERHQPDLLLLDLRLRSGDTLEFIKSLRARHSGVRILVISQCEETLLALRCMRAGADGYITKMEETTEIVNAVRTVLGGEIYVSRKVAALLFRQSVNANHESDRTGAGSLTDRELHVFSLLGAGLGTREIAHEMNLGIKTVETHRKNIKQKLGVGDAAELVRRAKAWARGAGTSRGV